MPTAELTADPAFDPPPAMSGQDQRRVRAWLTVLGVLGSASLLGVAFSPYLVTHWPLVLVALSPLGRHLVLAAPVVHPAAFVFVVVGRRLGFYLACFHLGRSLGPWGIPWIEARAARFARFVRFVERLFARAPHAVVLAMAGPTVSALAGISAMRSEVFVSLATVSLTLRAGLVLGFAVWIRVYVEIALGWIEAYWLPATAVTLVAALGFRWWRRTYAAAPSGT